MGLLCRPIALFDSAGSIPDQRSSAITVLVPYFTLEVKV